MPPQPYQYNSNVISSRMAGSGSPPRHAPLLRRQTSNLPGQVHHMAVMVAPSRVDYSVNKGGLRSWAVIIVFVLLCSAILNIFSEEGEGRYREEDIEEKESLATPEEEVEAFKDEEDGYEKSYHQKPKVEETKGKTGEAFGEAQEEGEEDDNDEEEEDEEEEDEEEEENENISYMENKRIKDEEELMLARLSEKSSSKRKGGKDRISKLMELKEEKLEQEKRKQQMEDEDKKCTAKNIVQEEENLNEQEEENKEEEIDEDVIVEEEILSREKEHQRHNDRQVHRRRVRSWRALQSAKSLAEGMKPRKELLKKRPKQNKYIQQEIHQLPGVDDEEEVQENVENEHITELIAQRKLPGSYSTRKSALTSRSDYRHRHLLDEADFLSEQHDFVSALEKYQKVLNMDRYSPRALFGRARVYQLMSEFADDGDNRKLLDKAMGDFESILLQNKDSEDIPDELFRISARYYVECARFRGGSQQLHKILQIQRALVDRFPEDLEAQCDFGATWLGMNRPDEAANVFKNILEVDPHHALAQAYYGYILKVYEGDLERGVNLMRRALRTVDSGNIVVNDQKFYFHLGDALTRLGRLKDAHSVYADAVKHGLFPSTLQRSLHNLAHLTARPWWTVEQTECSRQLRQLERHWITIKEEALRLWQNHQHLFEKDNYSGNLIETENNGHWILIIKDKSDGDFMREEICGENLMPYTCQMLRGGGFTDSVCARENIRLSVLRSGASTWPYCGPTNYVLESHLGLVTHSDARLRVGNETRGWKQGKMLIYDTSYEHEIVFEGAPANALRIALILELWHPEVPHALRGRIDEMDIENDNKLN
ncbi:hypothetical protein ACQ4LE_010989 [Meloidogyne hapla]